MATRRIKNITASNSTQPLKVGASNNVVMVKTNAYSQLMYRQNHRAPAYMANVWAKFDTVDFDGIQLVSFLTKGDDQEIVHAGNCTFKVYSIDTASWAETLLVTKTGVAITAQADGKLTADVTGAELLPTELDGEITLAIEVELFRFNRSFKTKKYVNHLGVYDSIIRLRQDVDFLSITKKDE